jgi:guanylate kinase
MDYKPVTESVFSDMAKQNSFLFVQDVEQNVRQLEVSRKQSLTNPILSMLTFGQKKEEDETSDFYYEWKRTGVRADEVSTILEHGKVALIECRLQDAIHIHETYHELVHQCNFIYVRPPSVEELRNRLIRDVERTESEASIRIKLHQMESDLKIVNGLDFINK